MTLRIESFKAYDIRGRIPDQINSDICYRIGNALGAFLSANTVVIGLSLIHI